MTSNIPEGLENDPNAPYNMPEDSVLPEIFDDEDTMLANMDDDEISALIADE